MMSKLFFSLLLIIAISSVGIAWGQPELVKTDTYITKAPILNLSGTSFDVFTNAYFKDQWVFLNLGAGSWTPSQIAFMRDDVSEGKPMNTSEGKKAFLGLTWENRN